MQTKTNNMTEKNDSDNPRRILADLIAKTLRMEKRLEAVLRRSKEDEQPPDADR